MKELNETNIGFKKKKACKQCPYAAKAKGFIGPYDNPAQLHQLANNDVIFPCHKTENSDSPQMCAGYVQYQAKIFKRSRHSKVKAYSDSMPVEPDNLGSVSGEDIIKFHGGAS